MSEEQKDFVPVADIFDQKLFSKIKEDKISPTPRWHFLLKNYVVWLVGGLALLIGAGAVSVLTYLFINNDWGIHQAIHKTWGEVLLLTLPYFWLIFLGLFIFVIYYNFKHTERGYRYPLWIILIASVLASIVLGEGLFLLGIGEKIDRVFSRRVPLYERFINPQLEFWSQPDEGRLVGVPIEVSENNNFILVDRNKKAWQIIPASSTIGEVLENMPLGGDMPPLPIRLLGEQISEEAFVVEKIIPLLPGRAFFDRPGHGQRPPLGPPSSDEKPSSNNKPVSKGQFLNCLELGKDGNKNGAKENGQACVLTDEGPVRSQPTIKN